MTITDNLFREVPSPLPLELFTTLAESNQVRIERIVSHGHSTTVGEWYDQTQHEWVCVLQGEARLRFEDQHELTSMRRGDWINIEAHRRHRVEWDDTGRANRLARDSLRRAVMTTTETTFLPGPREGTVRAADGTVRPVPEGWILLAPGDAALTRRVKAAGLVLAGTGKAGPQNLFTGDLCSRQDN